MNAFAVLAQPQRRQILDALLGGEKPVNDLVEQLGLSQPNVSKHLRTLREAGKSPQEILKGFNLELRKAGTENPR